MLWNHRSKNWVGPLLYLTYVISQILQGDPPDHYRCRARRKKKKNSRIHEPFHRLHLDYLSSWKYIIGICRGIHGSWNTFFSKMLSDVLFDVIWFCCGILLHKNIFVFPVSEKTSEKLNTADSGPATFYIGSETYIQTYRTNARFSSNSIFQPRQIVGLRNDCDWSHFEIVPKTPFWFFIGKCSIGRGWPKLTFFPLII
jgi:hypothetical protein